MATNTGTPGFDINGQTYVFDVGDPDAAGILPVPTDHGDIHVDNSPKDLSRPTLTTLAQYMSDVTLGKEGHSKGTSNQFPVSSPTNPLTEVSISDKSGNPVNPSPSTNTSVFTTGDASGVSVFSKDLQSAAGIVPDITTDPRTKLTGFVKGKSSTPGTNGNSLLQSVKKDSLPPAIKPYVSTVMSFNRFTDASPAAPGVSGLANDAPSRVEPVFHHPRYGQVTGGRMAQVGNALSLRAAQALGASSDGNNPTSNTQEIATLLPSPSQLGLTQVDAVVLQTHDVLKSLTRSEVPAGDYTNISNVSWGTLNSVDEPFWGANSLGMTTLAAALASAVVLVFEGLGFVIDAVKPGQAAPRRSVTGELTLGSYLSTGANDEGLLSSAGASVGVDFTDLAGTLGIVPTIFPFGQAVKAGVAAFFNVDTSTLGSALASGISSVSDSPGFNTIVARTIIRSSIALEQAFAAPFTSPDAGAAIDNAAGIIYEISRSKLIKSLNIFSKLGDVVLSEPDDLNVSPDAVGVKKSFSDAYPNNGPDVSVQKGKLQGSLKLAWSSNRAPSMYLVPNTVMSMQALDNRLGGFKGVGGLLEDLSKTTFKVITRSDQDGNTRISADDVAAFEATLDAEYMPFYFHDLRTNEIISFHAFLNTLTEDFSPAWETTEGFGRVDPISVYKHTGRKINVSFFVAATSEADFDDMWMKLNKFITLVYPQYTQGRTLTNGTGTTFVQPFSQMFSAAPIIRMRIGDLVRSNYSRFALARLFGAADGTMQIPNKTGTSTNVNFDGSAQWQQAFAVAQKDLATVVDPSNKFTVAASGWPLQFGVKNQAPTFNVLGTDLQYFQLSVLNFDKTQNVSICNPSLMSPQEMSDQLGLDVTTATGIHDALIARYSNPNDPRRNVIAGNGLGGYAVPVPMLSATPKTLANLFRESVGSTMDNIDALSDFLNPSKNALVKSFQSTQGKGLAGKFDTLQIDWHDHVTWETKIGSKAPKMCKVTLSFSVIHDISPGLDWNGYNRAPIWAVGAAMRGGKDDSSGTPTPAPAPKGGK